jgi:hypothetical protein
MNQDEAKLLDTLNLRPETRKEIEDAGSIAAWRQQQLAKSKKIS